MLSLEKNYSIRC